MNKKYLIALILGALLLFVGMVFSLFQSAFQSPEGKILKGTDYGYQTVEFTDSIYIYTGTTLLFAGSGQILKDDDLIVTEIKYSSGAAIMHRKLAITSGSLVTENSGVFRIQLNTGAVVSDVITDDGDTGLFKSVHKEGFINILQDDEIVIFGTGKWDYVKENSQEVAVVLTEENAKGDFVQRKISLLIEDLNANEADNIKIYASTGADLSNVEVTEVIEEKEEEIITKFEDQPVIKKEGEAVKTTTPKIEPEEVLLPKEIVTSVDNMNNTPVVVEDPITETGETDDEENSGLYWGEYPDTDEGNYALATDKINLNYCDRINDSALRLTCKETINEVLGNCELLTNVTKQALCKNAHIKSRAVDSDRLSKCAEIKNDDSLKNSCISEINQNLYDAAMESGDPNICKAIYNSTMLNKCLSELGVD